VAGTVYTAEDAAYWYAPLLRAVPAAALACVITFSGGFYTPEYGLASFGGYAVVAGILGIILSFRAIAAGPNRTLFVIQAIVSIVAGGGALVGVHGGLPVLILTIGPWGVLTGLIEVFAGVRARGKRAVARDWIFVGAVTVVLALVAFVIPPDYSQHYNAPGDGGSRILNTSVMIVGALGVYGAIVAVYLAIAAFSLKWGGATAKGQASKSKATS
jgi:hypothetical protein